MFETLSDRLGGVFDKLRGRGALTEDDVRGAMREVRVALLEADVALPVVREFIADVERGQFAAAAASERSQAATVPPREALLGRTLETRKTSSRRPAIASPTTSSASPYISAVSMWVMPRSRPRRRAATAVGRCASSMYQVPCPMTATSRGTGPNGRRSNCKLSLERGALRDAG